MSSEVKYVAFDPGQHTGWAFFDGAGQVLNQGYWSNPTELFMFLESMKEFKLTSVIIEQYRIRPDKQTAHAWSDVPALRVIGAIQYWCHQLRVPYTMQEPGLKTMGYKYMGAKAPRVKLTTHEMDAVAHGVYYLQVRGIRKPILKSVGV